VTTAPVQPTTTQTPPTQPVTTPAPPITTQAPPTPPVTTPAATTSPVTTSAPTFTPCTPPVNNEFGSALPLFDGLTAFSTLCASSSTLPSCFDDGADIFYRYRATFNGTVSIDTCSASTDFDTTLVAYTPGGQILECGDDFCEVRSKIVVGVTEGQEVIVRVAGFRRATGVGFLNVVGSNVTCPPWPGPSVCPLVYNTSCMTVNFVFENLMEGFGAQGCECGPPFVPPTCIAPPSVPMPPCVVPPPQRKCLTFNVHFGGLMASADPRTPPAT